MPKKLNLKGKKFGKLTVIEYSHCDNSMKHKNRHMWKCKCDCGNEKIVWVSNLTREKIKSCGCLINKPNLIGKRFGHGVVISEASMRKESNRQLWVLKCDCGEIYTASTSFLKGKVGSRKISCKCQQYKENVDSPNYINSNKNNLISGVFISRIRNGAKKRKLEFELDAEYLWNLYLKQNKKCIYTNWDIHFGTPKGIRKGDDLPSASLDRIDPNKGYIKGNVQWVHKHVNSMKWRFTNEYFIEICRCIFDNYEKNTTKKIVVGYISGFFDCLHSGHCEYIKSAAKKCDKLYVIVNNNKQTIDKKGYLFLDESERVYIINHIKGVTSAMVSLDLDGSVADTLSYMIEKHKTMYENFDINLKFFNSGDRPPEQWNAREMQVCEKHNVEQVFLPMPKVNSSSNIIRDFVKNNQEVVRRMLEDE